jgi:hypothetical protein
MEEQMFRSILYKLSNAILFYFMFVSVAFAAITDLKLSTAQIFDVQWYISGGTLHASGFSYIFASVNYATQTNSAARWTAAQTADANSNGRYIGFFNSTTNPGTYGMAVFNSNGSVYKIINNTGSFRALANGAIFYNGNGMWGTLITTGQGYSLGQSGSWSVTQDNPTNSQLQAYTPPSSTPLAAGQTAPPPAVATPIYNNSSNVFITNHYPTSNNSPASEGASKAFDNNPNTKYLNFDKQNAGVTIKLNAGRVVNEFTLTTANDFSGRDPTSYKLYASNDGVNWTLIQEGALSLSNDRFWTSPKIPVTNTNAYVYYYIFFPTTKSGDGCGLNCDSMQIAEITFYYNSGNTTTSTPTGTGSVTNPGTAPTPVYSSSINPSQAMRRAANLAETNGHNSNVNIVGSDNEVSIEQVGGSHYASVGIIGNSNNTDVLQTTTTSARHYLEASVIGNTNSLILQQRDTGKNAFVTVDGDNNTLVLNQKGLGNHYLNLSLIGDDHNATVIQDGSGNHAATVQLENGGGPWNFVLNQSGSTSKIYSLPHGMSNGTTVSGVCNIVAGCNLTVNQ